MKICIVLPAFNEAKVIGKVLKELKLELKGIRQAETQIVVIDDGSHDATGEEARKAGALVLRHVLNRGLGGALGTGIAYARNSAADILVTMDSDGQHNPADIAKALKPVISQAADVVIGSRLLGQKGMPGDRRLINWLSNALTFLFFGIWTSDSQSGFRLLNKKAIQSIELRTQEMEVSSEFFSEIKKNRLRLAEVPIQVIYTDYSRQKGQSNLNGLRILLKLILKLFR